jgi:hypothetical protein
MDAASDCCGDGRVSLNICAHKVSLSARTGITSLRALRRRRSNPPSISATCSRSTIAGSDELRHKLSRVSGYNTVNGNPI